MRTGAVLAATLAVLTCATAVQAKVVTTAKVRYETQDGHGRWYPMEVTLLAGSELNGATSSYRYAAWSYYAVVFFGPGQAAVIKLKSIWCSGDFAMSCVPTFGNMKGEDQDGTNWEICTSSFC